MQKKATKQNEQQPEIQQQQCPAEKIWLYFSHLQPIHERAERMEAMRAFSDFDVAMLYGGLE